MGCPRCRLPLRTPSPAGPVSAPRAASPADRPRARSPASRPGRRRRRGTRRRACPVSRLIFITPPNRKRSIAVDLDALAPRRERVTELVQHDRAEEQQRADHGGRVADVSDAARICSKLLRRRRKMNRNRTRNQDALTPIRMPKIRASWNELPPAPNMLHRRIGIARRNFERRWIRPHGIRSDRGDELMAGATKVTVTGAAGADRLRDAVPDRVRADARPRPARFASTCSRSPTR